MSFQEWSEQVRIMVELHLGHHDLPSLDYRGMWEDGVKPHEAKIVVLDFIFGGNK